MFGKILLAFDGSEHSLKAAEYAIKLAQIDHAHVEILHVVSSEKRYMRDSAALTASIKEEHMKEAEKIIAQGVEKFKDSGVQYSTKILLGDVGDPADEICTEAKQNDVKIIVMGSRGLNPLTRLLGSVSNKVLSHAHCPVLIVR